MRSHTTAISAVYGCLVGVLVYGLFFAVLPWQDSEQPYPYWALFLSHVSLATGAVIPGLAAGYLAKRPSFISGAMAGLAAVLTVAAISAFASWPSVILSEDVTIHFVVNAFAGALASSLTNGVASFAAAHIKPLPSNPPLNADARQETQRAV